MMSFKDIPKGIFTLPNLAMLVVLMKIAISDLSMASGFLMIPVVALFVAKVMIYDAKHELEDKIFRLAVDHTSFKSDLRLLQADQAEVSKQSVETKNLLSKANIATAFAPKARG